MSGLAAGQSVFSVREVRRVKQSWRGDACGSFGLDLERSETGGANVGEVARLGGRELASWCRDAYGILREIRWHQASLLAQSVPDTCADVQSCARIRRGVVAGRVP